MITKLRIKNFRGIKEGEIELAPLTILLGGNNSGNTTILEALFLAPNPFREVPYVIGGFTTHRNLLNNLWTSLI
jgi:predicted ATP-dependent endonuclease of OLD family